MKIWRALREPTVRLRLTAIYAATFALCGVVLVIVTFSLTANADALFPGIGGGNQVVIGTVGPSAQFPGASSPISSADLAQAVAAKQRQTLSQLAFSGGIALCLMLVVAVVLSWLAAGRVLRPLRSISTTARRLSEQNLQQRIGLEGPRDELHDLADTIDSMLDRLAAAFEAQRRFVANASHELRTPLTRERALVDVTLADPRASVRTLRAMGERIRASVDEQERLIDGLLTLARGAEGTEQSENVDLAVIAGRALAQVRGLPGHAEGLSLEDDLQPTEVKGNPELLERVAVNLLDNAMTHNVDGGRVQLTTRVEDGLAVLHVSNTGPVVSNDVVPMLFEPFRRRGQDRTGQRRGHGLGLSIVAALVKAHGGTVEALPREAGGMDVYVRLPGSVNPDGHVAV